MGTKGMFFNSIGHDRRYSSADWAEYFSSFVGNGIFAETASNLQVTANTNMTVKVLAGKGWIDGYMLVNTSDYLLTIPNADGILNRIDRIVMRLDFTNRDFKLAVLEGEPNSSPIAPALTSDGTVFELGIAKIYVAAGTTAITQEMITDTRFDESVCGIIARPALEVDTSGLFAQYAAEWEAFKRALGSDDAAANLQIQIYDTNEKIKKIRLGGI